MKILYFLTLIIDILQFIKYLYSKNKPHLALFTKLKVKIVQN